MSFFTRIFPAANQTRAAAADAGYNGIRSATGLSRPMLAALFRDNGLFGAESDLSPIEQAVVQSRLGRIPGLSARPALAPSDARSIALGAFTDAVVCAGGHAGKDEQAGLQAVGYSEAQVSEVIGVVRNVRDVFGLTIPASCAELRIASERSALARAA